MCIFSFSASDKYKSRFSVQPNLRERLNQSKPPRKDYIEKDEISKLFN